MSRFPSGKVSPALSCRAALPAAAPRSQDPSRAVLPCRDAQPSRAAFAEPRCPAEPRRTAEPHSPSACPATATTAAIAAMASPTVLTFDGEGRADDFDVWVDDLQLFLQCDSRDGVSLFDHTSSVSTSPAATADSTIFSQWTTRDAVARLAVRSHLPPAERAQFGQYKTTQSLYDAVVARYSSPATAALSRLMLPYLFPDLAAFATVADLIAHLRTSDARYRAALPTEFCAKNPPPPMYITLYYLVTCLPDCLSSVKDHFLSRCPTELTVDLLEESLAAGGISLFPFSPLLLLLLLSTSLALRRSDLLLPLVGGAATARARRARVVEGTAGAAAKAVEEAEGVAVEVGVVPGVGASVAAAEVVEAAAEVVEAAAAVVEATAVVVEVAAAVVLVEVQPRSMEALVVASASSSSRVPMRPRRPSSFVSGTLGMGGLGFPEAVELPCWHDLFRQNVAIFDLDFDAILAAMYALTDSAKGDCYLSVPPDPGNEAAALGASASAAPGTGESAAPGAGESALSGTANFSSPIHTARTGRHTPRPPPVPGTHSVTLRPSTTPLRIPLPSHHVSSLTVGLDPESDSLRASSRTFTRFLATAVTDPLFESTAASALVAEHVDLAAACRLDYAASLVAEFASASVCPPSVGGECALGTKVLEDRQEEFECFAAAVPHPVPMLLVRVQRYQRLKPLCRNPSVHSIFRFRHIQAYCDCNTPDILTPRSYAEAIEGPYSSQWEAAMDAEMASWKSTGTYVDEVPPPEANIVSGMWIFRVKRPPGSPSVFKARYVAHGFTQRQGVDFFQTFSPTPKMTTFQVLLHVVAHCDYELHSLDFSTAFLQGSLHEEIWLHRPPSFTGSFPAGTPWSLRWPVYGLRQAPREWHDTLRTTLAALGFAPSTADPSLFLRTDTTLLPLYVLEYVLQRFGFTYSSPQSTPLPTGHSLSAPPSDVSVEPSGPYPELVGCLITSGMGLVLRGRARVVLTGYVNISWVDDLATQRSSQGFTFSLGSGSVSWQSTCSSSTLNSSCEAEIYAGAMAVQELRWLTYLLTDLGEAPRSPPVLYVENKAMLALCQEHRLEHRTKHIALRYFLAQELQQRGQLRLAYVASQANTADVFTKALQPCDH
ncbi:unnamed protein product [Closterium sp. NIES-53]